MRSKRAIEQRKIKRIEKRREARRKHRREQNEKEIRGVANGQEKDKIKRLRPRHQKYCLAKKDYGLLH